MRAVLVFLSFVAAQSGLSALAEAISPVEAEIDYDAVILVAPFSDDDTVDRADLLAELSFNLNIERTLENGVRLRSRASVRAQKDNVARPAARGGFGDDPMALPGAFSGLSAGPSLDDGALKARLETGYIQIDGGYGEARLGKGAGVAARFFEGAPSVISHGRLDTALLDPTGLAVLTTRHDLTGPSAKLSYAAPRLLGVRAGISYTPRADADGLDRSAERRFGASQPHLDHAVELAVNATRRFRASGWRVDGALAWSSAQAQSQPMSDPYKKVETISAGFKLEREDWQYGASWLTSNNGLADGDYSAWSAGLAREWGKTSASLSYGEAQDDAAGLEAQGWQVGIARSFSDTVLSLSYKDQTLDSVFGRRQAKAIVLEITLSGEILNLERN
ncbi:MAG: porin [Pseudomonadota bacterium]